MDELAALANLKGIGHPLGEPEAVWAVVRGFAAAADTLDRSAKRLGATIASLERRRGWSGKAGTAFATRCREYQAQLVTAAETFREVVSALTAYAVRLDVARTMVDDARRTVMLSAGAAAIPAPDLSWVFRRADMAISEVRAASLVAATELRALASRATPVPGPVRRHPGSTPAAGTAIFDRDVPPRGVPPHPSPDAPTADLGHAPPGLPGGAGGAAPQGPAAR